MELLLNLPNLTADTLNVREKFESLTPVMLALRLVRFKHLAMLASDLRVDLDIPDVKSYLEERAR